MAANPRAGGGDNKEGNGTGALIAFAVIGILLYTLSWASFIRPFMNRSMVEIAAVEAHLILQVPSVLLPDSYRRDLEGVIWSANWLLSPQDKSKLAKMKDSKARAALDLASWPMAILTVLVMLFGMYKVYMTDMKFRYRRVFKLDNLIRHMAKTRPYLNPVAQVNPNKLDPHKGPWRRKHSYISFAVANRLLCDGKKREYKKQPGNHLAAYFNAKRAEAVFTKQLGAPWKGPATLTGPRKAIYGVMCAMIAGSRQEGIDACGAVAASIKIDRDRKKHGRVAAIDYSRAYALADRYGNHARIRKITRAHHFTGAVFMALKEAVTNRAGEFGSGHYLWLKLVDRECFYIIHQVGLDVAHMEAAGPFSHFHTEVRTGTPARSPVVTPAVTALRQHLINENWLNPDALDL